MKFCLIIAAAAALLIPAGTAGAATVAWASFGATEAGGPLPQIVGAPDGELAPKPWTAAKFDVRVSYPTLAAAMGISESELGRYDVLSWEANGGAPAAGGGFESAHWQFEVGGVSVATIFDERTGAGSNPLVAFKTGSISAAQYASLFGASRPDAAVWSWLLMRMPTGIDAHSPSFSVRFAPAPGIGEGTPDPDSIGVLTAATPEPHALSLAGLIGLAVLRRRVARARLDC